MGLMEVLGSSSVFSDIKKIFVKSSSLVLTMLAKYNHRTSFTIHVDKTFLWMTCEHYLT